MAVTRRCGGGHECMVVDGGRISEMFCKVYIHSLFEFSAGFCSGFRVHWAAYRSLQRTWSFRSVLCVY